MVCYLTLCFLFQLFGHENVSVLDGGLIKWADDGYEITVNEPNVEVNKNDLFL
jgi:3-mercaptopyruvate sulfurtransferase SseA